MCEKAGVSDRKPSPEHSCQSILHFRQVALVVLALVISHCSSYYNKEEELAKWGNGEFNIDDFIADHRVSL